MALLRTFTLPLRRIPHLLRPLRPPNSSIRQPRHFTQNHPKLLLVSPPLPRPQLPFLHNPSSGRLAKVTVRSPISRLISTERKAQWKRIARWQLRFHLFFWPAVTLLAVSGTSARQLILEQDYPTPPDWTVWSRWIMRNRKESEFGEDYRHGAISWDFLGEGYLQLLERLEKGPDAKGVKETNDEGGVWVAGIGKTGYDVSAKSNAWKQGYYEALMGTSRVAENLDGWVKHKDGKSRSFPADMIEGPRNPEPKPVPSSWRGTPPAFDDCVPAFESPAVFYTRILTTKGLTSRMKVDAAVAWADWLDFKGLTETAEEVLKWGRDIAASGMHVSALDEVVDVKTGALKSQSAKKVSENMFKTSTALAVHHARAGAVDTALPIFLSILRVRRDLPPSLQGPRPSHFEHQREEGMLDSIWKFIRGPVYPMPPTSGDEPPTHSLKEACEQTGIMTYIGEILYSTSSHEDGLSWTRDAVDGAEAILWSMRQQGTDQGKEKCEECLETGLLNWKKMASLLAIEADIQNLDQQQKEPRSSWFGLGKKQESDGQRWLREQEQIELRIQRTKPLLKNRFGQVEVTPRKGSSTILTV